MGTFVNTDDVLRQGGRRPQELAGRAVEVVHDTPALPGMPVITRRSSPGCSLGLIQFTAAGSGRTTVSTSRFTGFLTQHVRTLIPRWDSGCRRAFQVSRPRVRTKRNAPRSLPASTGRSMVRVYPTRWAAPRANPGASDRASGLPDRFSFHPRESPKPNPEGQAIGRGGGAGADWTNVGAARR